MKKIRCPHCKKIDDNEVYPAAIHQTKIYDEIDCYIRCSLCKKMYSIGLRMAIVTGKPKKLGDGAIPTIPVLAKGIPIPEACRRP
jgi:hypothetical protein